MLSAKNSAARASVSVAVGVHAQAMCVRLAQLLGEGVVKEVTAAALRLALVEERLASGSEMRPPPAVAGDGALLPRLIGDDDNGKAADAQDEIIVQNGGVPERMPVASWA